MVESAKNSCGKSDSHLRTNFRDGFFGEFTWDMQQLGPFIVYLAVS